MKKVAVMIDAGFLQKVYKKHNGGKNISADKIVALSKKLVDEYSEELFRIYYYDAPPFADKLTHPIAGNETDYSESALFKAVSSFHIDLAEKEFIALRRGKLSFSGWRLSRNAFTRLKANNSLNLQPEDIEPDFKQKGVDMNIGLDMALLSTKKIVDKIILVTGDSDFVPAMKFARKEGARIAVCVIDGNVTSELKQHSDQIINFNLSSIK